MKFIPGTERIKYNSLQKTTELYFELPQLSEVKHLNEELTNQISASRKAIGKYECNETVPLVDAAKNIANVFEVSIDYLTGDILRPAFDKKMVERLENFELGAE